MRSPSAESDAASLSYGLTSRGARRGRSAAPSTKTQSPCSVTGIAFVTTTNAVERRAEHLGRPVGPVDEPEPSDGVAGGDRVARLEHRLEHPVLGRDHDRSRDCGRRGSRPAGRPSEARVCTSPSSTPTWRSTFVRPLQASRCTGAGTRPPPPSSVVITSLPWFSASTGQQAGAVDVDVEEVPVAVPRLHALEHRLALRGVVDDVHVRARQEPGAAPAGVHVDHDVGEREEHAREVVGELLVRRPVGAAGERAVEVRARRPVARVRLRRRGREHRDRRSRGRRPARAASSWSRRSAATWPSYSSPWLPARTSTVGPSPFAIDAMWTKVLAQPAVFVIFGNARWPICLPGRREVDRAGDRRGSLMRAPPGTA